MTGPIPMRPNLPMLVDSGNVIREAALVGSQYLGRIFYLKRRGWEDTRYPDYISRSEADNYKANGKTIVLNFEHKAANWCLGGYVAGLDAGNVSADELDAIDCANAMVYLSADFRPANSSEMAAVMECLRGFQASRLGRRGRAIYGFAPTMREAKRLGLADYFWMCGDGRELFSGNWTNGQRVPDLMHVNIWQQNNEQPSFAGTQVDDNYIFTPDDYGQWRSDTNQGGPMADIETLVHDQLSGPGGQGWEVLGRSKVDPSRFNTVVEALAEVRNALLALTPSLINDQVAFDLPTNVRLIDAATYRTEAAVERIEKKLEGR